MGCQQSKIKNPHGSVSKVPLSIPKVESVSAAVCAPSAQLAEVPLIVAALPSESVSRQVSSLKRATRVTFIASREASPEVTIPDATAPETDTPTPTVAFTNDSVDVPSPPRTASRSKSSSLEGIEPDVFQISKACSLEKMYRRWNRKNTMIAERNAAILTTFVPSMSAIMHSTTTSSDHDDFVDYTDVTESVLVVVEEFLAASESKDIIGVESNQASPERGWMAPFSAEVPLLPSRLAENLWLDSASPLKSSINTVSSSPNQTHDGLASSALRARSTNSTATGSRVAHSPSSWKNSCNSASSPLQSMQASFAISQFGSAINDENAAQGASFVDCASMTAKNGDAPCNAKKARHPKSKKSNKKSMHDEFGTGPVAPRWDKGSRALMRTQVYLEMTEAFLASSGDYNL